ncbi:MAG TPA: carboxyltransferase domain-containing protein, partial [Acidimicrobiales bacterium]|nr:carboxyltransferase domain-containing protein [Acidimicrobiales bacterium]
MITPFGDTALLVDVEDDQAAHQLAARIESDPSAPPGIGEVVVGLRSVLVRFDPLVAYPLTDEAPMGLEAWLAGLGSPLAATAAPPAAAPAAAPGLVEIPVTFDGPDLEEVAATIDATVEEVADLLTGVELRVAFLGFAPGFPYLVGLPEPLARIERRASPRTQVPPGSVALAAGFAAVYPQRTPGGWQLLGHTDVSMFNPEKPPYALLRAGDTVRFTFADSASAPSHRAPIPDAAPSTGPSPAPSNDSSTGPATTSRSDLAPNGPPPRRAPVRASTPRFIEVIEPGTLTLMQDAGRQGVAAIGVPAAGPADPDRFRLANRLVGNAEGAAALELTARGPIIRFSSDGYVAVVGDVDLKLDDRAVAADMVIPISAGQVLAIGVAQRTLRSYLAVAGGLEGPLVLGSRSSDLLSGLGIGPLRAGDKVDLGPPGHPRGRLSPREPDPSPSGPDPTSSERDPSHREPGPAVRVVPGPHHAADAELQKLTRPCWTVDDRSNRVGLRLSAASGEMAIQPPSLGVPSCGMVTGAIQIPPDGQPIVLMPDHATVGGYPVIATVVSADWG